MNTLNDYLTDIQAYAQALINGSDLAVKQRQRLIVKYGMYEYKMFILPRASQQFSKWYLGVK